MLLVLKSWFLDKSNNALQMSFISLSWHPIWPSL